MTYAVLSQSIPENQCPLISTSRKPEERYLLIPTLMFEPPSGLGVYHHLSEDPFNQTSYGLRGILVDKVLQGMGSEGGNTHWILASYRSNAF